MTTTDTRYCSNWFMSVILCVIISRQCRQIQIEIQLRQSQRLL